MPHSNPVLVEVTRGAQVESIHRGSAVVVGADGVALETWGDADGAVYPRSAVKPLQAVPLLATGAAEACGVTAAETALACASHSGEAIHTQAVEQWLHRLGYDVDVLECGAHPPSDKQTRDRLTRNGEAPSPLHNNCSGKHAGFLTICRHLGFDAAGYIHPDHPVQKLVRDTLASLTGCALDDAACAVDGCGIPVYGIPLRGLATAMMRLADPSGLDTATAAALDAVRTSMVAHPRLVAGRGRFCTDVMAALAPNVVAKTGAEGVYCAALRQQRLGIALKIDDGATRASEVALGAILRRMDAVDDSHFAALRSKLEPEVLNVAGKSVGMIRASSAIL